MEWSLSGSSVACACGGAQLKSLAGVDRMDLARFPRRRYTHAPTPIELLPHFTKALAASCPGGVGPEIWIKRDDLLGLFPGGNKTRKLEFLAADALAQGADTLITCGAPQSNHCRITLSAAVKEGLKCRFVIEERVPGQLQEGSRRQQLHVRADGRRSHHRGARRFGHGCGDVEGRAGSRLARSQGLHHPGRRFERDRRFGLCRVRAGNAAAMARHGRWRSMPSWSARAVREPMAAWRRASSATTSRSR